MRIEGKLTKWHDDRGFGFITPTQGGPDVFMHISALPKDGHRPEVGERVTFEIEVDKQGKKRATHVFCPDQPAARAQPRHKPGHRSEKPGFLGRAISLLLVAGVGYYGYLHFTQRAAPQAALSAPVPTPVSAAPQNFSCDGRTHCSQMKSCEEAKFFLRNCPGTQMDGDGDGIPCEQQWCN